jgi:aspartate carbamoyltransferase catalytic subunit
MKKSRKDIISMRDLGKEEILHILKTAKELEENPQPELMKGRVVSTLFFEPSTRTRLSFWSAAQRLGAQVLGFDNTEGTSAKKGESLVDTIRMAAAYSDVIVMRHPNDGAARLASEVSRVPILNAGDGSNQHPSQTLLDLYTIQKKFGTLENHKIAFVGDLKYGRTVHSLAKAMTHFGATMYFVAPETLQMPEYICEDLDKAGIEYYKVEDYREILGEIDIFYMTRIQRERFPDDEEYEKVKGVYIINKESIIGKCREDMIIMHPLPRVNEIEVDLDDSPHAMYFEQAANGVPTRQAMLALSLGLIEKLGDE